MQKETINLAARGEVSTIMFSDQTYAIVQTQAFGGSASTWDGGTLRVLGTLDGRCWSPLGVTLSEDGIRRIDVIGMAGLRVEVETASSGEKFVDVLLGTTFRS